MNDFLSNMEMIFGLRHTLSQLTLSHLCMRAFLVYFGGIFLVRIQKQFITINTPFNYMINFIIGSLLANAIVGEGPYFKILAMCCLIYSVNMLIEILCYYSVFFENIFKGQAQLLIENGNVIRKNMRKNFITEDELMQAVRSQINENSITHVKRAYFENNGQITIIKK